MYCVDCEVLTVTVQYIYSYTSNIIFYFSIKENHWILNQETIHQNNKIYVIKTNT